MHVNKKVKRTVYTQIFGWRSWTWILKMPLKEKKRPLGSGSSSGESDEILERLLSIQDRIENGFTKIYNDIEA